MSAREHFRNSEHSFDHQSFLGTDEDYEFLEFYTDGDPVVVVTGDWEYAFRDGNTFLYRREKASTR